MVVYTLFIIDSPMNSHLLQAFQNLLQVFQVVSIILANDVYVTNVAAHLWNAIQDNIHGLLKHCRCQCDAIGQPGVVV